MHLHVHDSTCTITCTCIIVFIHIGTGIKVPPRIKKRGRPKGHELTTIGLPAKKAKIGKLCAFTKLHTSDKEKRKYKYTHDVRKEILNSFCLYRYS